MQHLITVLITTCLTLCLRAEVGTVLLSSDFFEPVWAESPEGVSDNLWVVEKAGLIYTFNPTTKEKNLFLDISDRIEIKMNEQGLLGLAFSEDFLQSGRFYLNYTNVKGDTEICRFTAHGADKMQCRADSSELLLSIKQISRNHNGGWLGFGPDGYLYIATGDGGKGFDPQNKGQDLSSHLGKILRIDASPETGYSVPADNPFINTANAQPEIYSYGLRNPWRCSFDRSNGDFYIADVGQREWEEVNYCPSGDAKGANFGWRLREGFVKTNKTKVGGEKPSEVLDPIYTYKHGGGQFEGVSVTGGYVYRGPIKSLQGKYFFADYANPRIWSFEVKNGEMKNPEDWTKRLKPEKGSIMMVASFNEDPEGNLLIISHGGSIYKVVER